MNIVPNIDGKGISESIAVLLDKIRYRKFAKEGYTTVIWINASNTIIKILDGRIKDGLLTIPALDAKKQVNKVYILPSKKIVTKLCFVKEDINITLDLLITDTSKLSDILFKQLIKIKLMEDLQAFNMGQVLLGGSIGFMLGSLLTIGLMMVYAGMM